MKKSVPVWCWIVMSVLVVIIIFLFMGYSNVVSVDKYTECVLSEINTTKEYLSVSWDYLTLLDCYQKSMPICEALANKSGYNPYAFRQYSTKGCSEGYYIDITNEYCCPEPIMKVENNTCVRNVLVNP